jgi:hypothetical protein
MSMMMVMLMKMWTGTSSWFFWLNCFYYLSYFLSRYMLPKFGMMQ